MSSDKSRRRGGGQKRKANDASTMSLSHKRFLREFSRLRGEFQSLDFDVSGREYQSTVGTAVEIAVDTLEAARLWISRIRPPGKSSEGAYRLRYNALVAEFVAAVFELGLWAYHTAGAEVSRDIMSEKGGVAGCVPEKSES